jgi:hypothetical protein
MRDILPCLVVASDRRERGNLVLLAGGIIWIEVRTMRGWLRLTKRSA